MGRDRCTDWDGYYEVIRDLQPNAVISVCGPDVCWCGNEAGHTRESEWSAGTRLFTRKRENTGTVTAGG